MSKLKNRTKIFTLILVSFTVYLVAGRLGLLLALPPGFASVIWPASGVALAIVLRYGKWPLAGIWLGSFVVNCVQSDWSFSFSWVAIAIGLGATLQTYAGCLLINIKRPTASLFLDPNKIRYFFCFVAPVSCLVSSTIGIATLVAANNIGYSEIYVNWFTWIIGDSLGVVLFTPITLLIFERKDAEWKTRLHFLIPSTLICMTVFILLFIYASQRERDKIDERLRAETAEIGFLVETKLMLYQKLLQGVIGHYISTDEVTQKSFRTYLESSTADISGYKGIAWVPRLQRKDVSKFKVWLKKQDINDFKIKNIIENDQVNPEKTPYLYPMTFLSSEDFKNVRGLDWNSDPLRSDAIKRVEITKKSYTLSNVKLLSGPSDGNGIVIILPIFRSKNVDINVFPSGFILFAFQAEEAFADALNRARLLGFDIELNDDAGQIFLDGKSHRDKHFPKFFNKSLKWTGGNWQISIRPKQNYLARNRSWDTWLILTIGLIFCSFVQIFILILTGSNFQISVQVDQRTKELALSKIQFSTAMDAAVLANKAKSVFLSNISHEIRTPLNGIVGLTRLLALTELNSKQATLLKALEASNLGLLSLLNDTLDLSKIEAGVFEIESNIFEPRQLLKEVINTFEPLATSKGIVIYLDFIGKLPTKLMGDSFRIRQVVLNLISNSIKFSNGNDVNILAEAPASDELTWIIKVIDKGVGMKQEVQDKIFTPFVQGDGSTGRKFGGTGLGLAISKEIVDLMGGSIKADSTEGEGSTFSVTLPLVTPDNLAATQPIAFNSHDIQFDVSKYQGMKILLVEDNEVNRLVALGLLEQFGIIPDEAINGEAAVEKAFAVNYDVIFMDIHMPGMDGIEAAKTIRMQTPHQPFIIAVTADVTTQERRRCSAGGLNYFLSKPLILVQLRDALDSGFDNMQQPSSTQDFESQEPEDVGALPSVGSLLENNPHLLKTMIRSCLKVLPKNFLDIKKSLKERNSVSLGKTMHEAKGMIACFGYPNIVSKIVDLEDALGKKNFDESVIVNTEEIVENLKLIRAELDTLSRTIV